MSPREIWTDANWREPGTRPAGWDVLLNQHHANSKAALLDPRPKTTMRDVLAMTAGPIWRALTRHAPAFVAAVRAYRSVM